MWIKHETESFDYEKSKFAHLHLKTEKQTITKNPRSFIKNLKNNWLRPQPNLDKPPPLKNLKYQNKNRGKKKKAINQNPFLLFFSFVVFLLLFYIIKTWFWFFHNLI